MSSSTISKSHPSAPAALVLAPRQAGRLASAMSAPEPSMARGLAGIAEYWTSGCVLEYGRFGWNHVLNWAQARGYLMPRSGL